MKWTISKIIAFLCYYLGLDSLFYFLNRHSKRIITFHNVIPSDLLPEGKKIGLTDTEEELRMKVRIIKRHFFVNTDIKDTSSVTLTFDDGYENQVEIAGRILDNEGIPAIIFAAGRMIDNKNPEDALVVDLLLHWTWLAPNGRYEEGSLLPDFELRDTNRQMVWQQIMWPAFCKDSESKGRALLDVLNQTYPITKVLGQCSPEYLRLRLGGITADDIQTISAKGWLVGWHTREHYPLSKLSSEEKKTEIMSAPEHMKNIVFSYPYGELDSVDKESIAFAREGGFPCAVSNVEQHNGLMGKYFLPRMMLDGNFYQCQMELSGLKYFIKTRKLLPVLGYE